MDVENQRVDLFRREGLNRGPKRNLEVFPDRVVRDEATHTLKVEDQSLALDRDHAVPSRRDPGVVLDPAIVENQQVDPSLEEGQNQIPDQSARVAPDHVVDRSRAPEDEVPLDPDEDRGLGVAPNPAAASRPVIRRDVAEDPLLSLKSREPSRDHPDGNRVAVPGLCRNPPIGEVVLGREQFPQITLMSKT